MGRDYNESGYAGGAKNGGDDEKRIPEGAACMIGLALAVADAIGICFLLFCV